MNKLKVVYAGLAIVWPILAVPAYRLDRDLFAGEGKWTNGRRLLSVLFAVTIGPLFVAVLGGLAFWYEIFDWFGREVKER